MRKITQKVYLEDGTQARENRDMYKLLNHNIQRLLNQAERAGEYGFPVLHCNTDVFPDYLALFCQPGYYHKTKNSGVCFYSYDISFDDIHGLFNAIYYGDRKLLEYYKERFRGVKFFITPDYSVFGDIQKVENLQRIWKARIVALWFIIELHAVVIPNIMYYSEESLPITCCGLEKCSVVAFSAKGHVRYATERRLTKYAIKYVVDHFPLKAIVVYSACGVDANCLKLFQYAIDKGVEIIIPDNSLRARNMERRNQK